MSLLGRRKFLQLSTAAFPLVAFSADAHNKQAIINNPIMISNWDEGQNVNAAAWNTLKTKERALDAFDVGAIYIENKINNQSPITVHR